MAFPVAVQSALFYVLACTPCTAARGRYRTRKQSKREREERALREDDEPDLYRHPSPFNTNPYWEEDIRMGPSLPPKKGRGAANAKSTSQRKLTSSGKDSGSTTHSSLAVGHGPDEHATGRSLGPLHIPDDAHSLSMMEAVSPNTLCSEGWNYKLYQREDEELWGEVSRTHKLMDAIVKAGSSAGRLLESTLGKDRSVTDEDRANFYAPAVVHPPVNEYHPPVVSSKPAHKDALRWMLQPPPPAKVMEGKVPVSRSTSIASSAGGSRMGRRSLTMTAGSEVSLTRRMALEARLRRVESNRSAAGSKRPMTPSSEMLADRLSLAMTPSRMVARNPSTTGTARTKSQRQAARPSMTRSRSDSFGSSTDGSSDEGGDGMRRGWRMPSHTGSVKATTGSHGRPRPRPAGDLQEDADADDENPAPRRTQSVRKTHEAATTTTTTTATRRPKLSSIPSQKAATVVRQEEVKTDHPRSASSSLDSGLALSA